MALSDLQLLYNYALSLIGEYQVEETDTTSKQYLLCSQFYERARDEVIVSHLWNEAITRAQVLQETTEPIHTYSFKYEKPSDCLRVVSIGDDDDTAEYSWQVEGNYIITDYRQMPETWQEGAYYAVGQYVSRNNITYLCNTAHQSATAWESGKIYNVGDRVISSSTYYICTTAHTSTTFASDIVKWSATVDDDPDANTSLWTTQSGNYGLLNLIYVKQLTDIDSFSPRLYDAIGHKLAIKIVVAITGDMKNKVQLMQEFETLVMPQARSVDAQQGTPRPIYNSKWLRDRR